MRMGPRLLLEIVKVVQEGMLDRKDISDMLRQIEVGIDPDNAEVVELMSYVNLKTGGY